MDTESGVQAFVRLQNSDDEDHTVDVSVFADGELFDASSGVEVKKENSTIMSFNLTPLLADFEKAIQVEVRIENEDVYPIDNVAYGVIEPPRKVNVLVCSEFKKHFKNSLGTTRIQKLANVTFESAAHLKSKEYLEAVTLGSYDLIIFDQCAPDKMPDCSTVFVGAVPPAEQWSAAEKSGPTIVIDSLATHPIMSAVQMGNVIIVESRALEGPQGTISLMDSTEGSIMSIAPRSGFQDLVIGFPLDEINEKGDVLINSDWPQKLSFPLFMQNCVSWLGGAAKFSSSSGTSPGELVRIRTKVPTQSISVENPAGSRIALQPRQDKSFIYSGAETTGIYEVTNQDSDSLDQLLSVNLLDPRESNLAVRDELEIGYEEISKTTGSVPARKEYWTWVILAALIVLLVEWYIYNRRVFI